MRFMLTLGILAGFVLSPTLALNAADITGTGHRFFAADYDKHVMAIVGADGKVEWKREKWHTKCPSVFLIIRSPVLLSLGSSAHLDFGSSGRLWSFR